MDDTFDFAAIVREVQGGIGTVGGSASSAASPAGIDGPLLLSRARTISESYAVRGVRVDTGLLMSILETEFGLGALAFRARVADVLAEVQRAAPKRAPSPPIISISPQKLLVESEDDESIAAAPRGASAVPRSRVPVVSTYTKRAPRPSPPFKTHPSRVSAHRDAESDDDDGEGKNDNVSGDEEGEEVEVEEVSSDDDDSAYSDADIDDDDAIIIVDSDSDSDAKDAKSTTPKKGGKPYVLKGKSKKETTSMTPSKKARPTTGRTREADAGTGAGAGAGAGAAEDTQARGPKHSATLPLLLPKNLKSRSTLLVQIEDSKFDLSGA